MQVPIDCIAATSMGAVVGGLYASGLSADELEARLSHINLSDIAFDRNERAELPQSQREDDLQYPIGISAGYGDGKIKLPTGLVQGNRLLALLQELDRAGAGRSQLRQAADAVSHHCHRPGHGDPGGARPWLAAARHPRQRGGARDCSRRSR
ncbi:patatin-like phospholipase family protein [Cupriavidus basilensis]